MKVKVDFYKENNVHSSSMIFECLPNVTIGKAISNIQSLANEDETYFTISLNDNFKSGKILTK